MKVQALNEALRISLKADGSSFRCLALSGMSVISTRGVPDMQKVRLLSLSLLFFFGLTGVSLAQQPAVHEGSDWRRMNLNQCATNARVAMGRQNLAVSAQGGLVWGSNANAVVLVHCIPMNGGVFIEVVAASPNSQTAEFYRNTIRTYVFDTRPID
jgi:hypothetical protein